MRSILYYREIYKFKSFFDDHWLVKSLSLQSNLLDIVKSFLSHESPYRYVLILRRVEKNRSAVAVGAGTVKCIFLSFANL